MQKLLNKSLGTILMYQIKDFLIYCYVNYIFEYCGMAVDCYNQDIQKVKEI